MKKILAGGLLLLAFNISQARPVWKAIVSGNWETGTTWSQGSMPNCGDSVYIPNGITVTVTVNGNYPTGCGGMAIVIAGVFEFQTGKKITFPCGSYIDITSTGEISANGNNGNSNNITICSTTFWQASDGNKFGTLCWNCAFLPVTLLNFDADCNGKAVDLSWSTATEINNNYFNIDRSSDGYNWTQIAQIPGSGNSTSQNNYNWIDESPLSGTAYYRLKQTDLDGTSTYPGLAASSCTTDAGITIYPNPSRGSVFCKISSQSQQPYTATIVNELGQEMGTSTDIVEQGETIEPMPTSNLKPGVYFLIMNFPNSSLTVRKPFVISN